MKVSIVLIGVLTTSLWQIVLSIEDFNLNPGPFNYSIKIVEHLSTQGDIVEGNRVTLKCEIDPPNALTFWRHAFHVVGTDKVVSTNPKHGVYAIDKYLTFEKIEKTNEGRYECVGYPQQHPVQLHSNQIDLRVKERPKVQSKDSNITEIANVTLRLISPSFTPQNVEQFSDISLECDVSPDSIIPLNYTFFLDNMEVAWSKENIDVYDDGILKLRRIEPTSAGLYMCKVENDEGYLLSNFLPINVLEKKFADEVVVWLQEFDTETKFQADLAAVRAHTKLGYEYYPDDIREGDSVYFICSIDSNVTQIRQITWFQNGRILEINEDIGIRQKDPYLLLQETPKEMAGDYNCMVETTHNTTINSTTTTLSIKYNFNESGKALECPCPNNTNCPCKDNKVQPEVLMQLKPGINPEIIMEGDNVTFTCLLFPLRVTRIRRIFWYHNGQKLSRTNRVGMLHGNTTLILPRIQKYHAGSYQCMIDTDLAPYYSKQTVVITVYDRSLRALPTVTAKLGNRWYTNRVKEYDDVYFRCEIEPDFKNVHYIEWSRNGKILNRLESYIFTIYWNTILVVPKIGILAAGKYECLVTTKTGVTIRSNPVDVIVQKIPKGDPIPRKNLLVIPTIEWHPEEIFENKPITFKCHYYLYSNTEIFVKVVHWYYKGKMLRPIDDEGKRWYKYENRDLLIPELKKKYEGEFNCMVRTNRGNFWSEFPAKLERILEERSEVASQNDTVITTLVAELQNNPDDIYEDDPVFFWCDVQPNTTDIVTIYWYFNDTIVHTLHPEPDHYFIPYGDRNHIIPFAKINKHAGDIFCEVITFQGIKIKSSPTKLVVKKREQCFFTQNDKIIDNCPVPDFIVVTVQLGDPWQINFIHEYDNIYFTCNVNPRKLRVFESIFYLDGRRIYPDKRGSIIYQDNELHIYNIAKDATGNYSCEVRTKQGPYRSGNEVHLEVRPPRF